MLTWALLVYVGEWVIRLVMLVVITRSKPPSSAMAWLLVIFLQPYVGLAIYLMIGTNSLPKRRLLQRVLGHTQTLGQLATTSLPGRNLGNQELQIAEGDGVQEHPNPALRPQQPAQLIENYLALLGTERIGVERPYAHTQAADLLELGLNPGHGTAPVAVHDAQIHPLLAQLLSRGETEATRSAQNQRPVPGINCRVHAFPSPPPPTSPGRKHPRRRPAGDP